MNNGRAPARIGLFRSPAAIRNFSMDGYADSLGAALRDGFAGAAVIEDVRPGPETRSSGSAATIRLADFGARYPRYLLAARSSRFDVNHVMDHAYGHLAYALDSRRTVITCHDIFPLRLWKGTIPGLRRRLTPPVTVLASLSGLRRTRAVITSTQATKSDLTTILGLDPARIHVIPYGLDASFRVLTAGERAEARQRLSFGGDKHILSVDTGTPYKNRRAGIEVLARVRAATGLDVRIARVGPQLGASDRALATARGVGHAIIELGALSRKDLVAAYNLSDVLLFPSLYEGFGWPPLEAMACGLPVVTSTTPAVAEVVLAAALSADALDYDGLAARVREVLDGATPALRDSGLARAATFTWEQAARDVASVYGLISEELLFAPAGKRATEAQTPCAA